MKFTNTEAEDFVEKLQDIIKYYRDGYENPESTIDTIEEICEKFYREYCCDAERYTWEWYDDHGE